MTELVAEIPEKLSFLFEPHRYKVAHGGRGSAKSWSFARALLIEGAQAPLRIGCFREIQRSIKDSVHKLLGDQIIALNIGWYYDVLDAVIRGKQHATEFLFSGLQGHTVDSIKSYEGLDRAWVEEAQTVGKRSWDILTPTIRKPGSEVWVSLNPDLESDETYQRFVEMPPPGAKVVQVNWQHNPWFTAELEAERQATLARDPEGYQNIWEGVPKRTVDGAIYKHEIDRLYARRGVRPVPYDPLLKVHTIWDLGWNDSMAIIMVQRSIAEVRVIDYIEDSHKRLDEYVAMLNQRGYNWGEDWIPHDGKTKNIQTGKSAEEVLKALKRDVRITPDIGVEPGIKAVRLMFDRCYFDEVKALPLVNRLKRYRRAIPVATGEPAGPLHDENSHGADAFRYLGVAVDKLRNDTKSAPIKYPKPMGVV